MTSSQLIKRWSLVVALALTSASSVPVAAKDSTLVVNDENPDRYPYYEIASVTIGPPFVNNFIQFPTPPGSRYFIEQVSLTCVTPSSSDIFTQALLTVTKITGPNSLQFIGSPVLALQNRGPAFLGGYLWSDSAHVKVISEANPGTVDGSGSLFFNIFHTDSAVQAVCTATLFGHSLPL